MARAVSPRGSGAPSGDNSDLSPSLNFVAEQFATLT
jgi:hypothetical protein